MKQTASHPENSIQTSVIIATYNGAPFLKPCLDSLLQNKTSDIEIIVINDFSTDNTADLLTLYAKDVTIITNSTNRGASYSRNRGVEVAKGKYIVFLDTDCESQPHAIANMLNVLENNPRVGCVQALLLKTHNTIESAGHYLSIIGFPYEIGVGESVKEFLSVNTESSLPILGGKTAALALRKDIFTLCGGFDEDYIIYGEDTDLCWTIWQLGYEVHCVLDSPILHKTRSSISIFTSYRIFYEGVKNNTSNILKHATITQIVYMLPLHTLAWLVISIVELIRMRPQCAVVIYKGLMWNIRNFRKTHNKRKRIFSNNTQPISKAVLFGPLSFSSLLSKGVKWIFNL